MKPGPNSTITVVNDPARLEEALRENRTPGDKIVLGPGDYPFRGSWAFPEFDYKPLADGVNLIAEQPGSVRIYLDQPVTQTDGRPRPDRDLSLFRCGAGCTITGIHFDGNERVVPGDWYVTEGVRAHGGLTMSGCKFSGLRGSYLKNVEAFPLSVIGPDGGSEIEHVVIEDVGPSSYVSAILIGHLPVPGGNPPRTSTVKHFKVDLGGGNWFGISGNVNVRFENGEVRGARIGVYNDTKQTEGVEVEAVEFEGVEYLVSLRVQGSDPTPKSNVALRDCVVMMKGDSKGEARVVELHDIANSGAKMGPVLLSMCDIMSEASTLWGAAVVGRNAGPVVFDGVTGLEKAVFHPRNAPVVVVPRVTLNV